MAAAVQKNPSFLQFAAAAAPVLARAKPTSRFFVEHLGGSVRFEPELVAFLGRVRCTRGDRHRMNGLKNKPDAPKFKDRDEVAVMSTESRDGVLSVNYRIAGYSMYLYGAREEINTRVSLLSVGAMVLTAGEQPEVLFQTRSREVHLGKGKIGMSVEGSVRAMDDAPKGRLEPVHAVMRKMREDLGTAAEGATFVGAIQDTELFKCHVLGYEVRLPYTREEIEGQRRHAEGSWKIWRMGYVRLPELHRFIARESENLTPAALFGALFVGVRHFGEQWVGKVVESIDKLRQN